MCVLRLYEEEQQKLVVQREAAREINANFRQLKEDKLHPLLQKPHTPSEHEISFSVFSLAEAQRRTESDNMVPFSFLSKQEQQQNSQNNKNNRSKTIPSLRL